MLIGAKLLYRLGIHVAENRNVRTEKVIFDREARDAVNHLLSLYEALEEIGFDLQRDIEKSYKTKSRINRKCSTERLLEKIGKLTAFAPWERDVYLRRKRGQTSVDETLEELLEEETFSEILTDLIAADVREKEEEIPALDIGYY